MILETFRHKLQTWAKVAMVSPSMVDIKSAAKGEPVTIFNLENDGFFALTTEIGMYRIWERFDGWRRAEMAKGYSAKMHKHFVHFPDQLRQ